MQLKVTTPPTLSPVSLASIKTHLGVTSSDRDTEIESLVAAAAGYIERRTGLTFAPRTYQYVLAYDEVPSGLACGIPLPGPPVSSITSIQYRDTSDALVTLTGAQLESVPDWASIYPVVDQVWPSVRDGRRDAFTVTYTAGSDPPPAEAVHAIKLLVRHWYDNAGAVIVGTISKEIDLGLASLVRALGRGFYAGASIDETG